MLRKGMNSKDMEGRQSPKKTKIKSTQQDYICTSDQTCNTALQLVRINANKNVSGKGQERQFGPFFNYISKSF